MRILLLSVIVIVSSVIKIIISSLIIWMLVMLMIVVMPSTMLLHPLSIIISVVLLPISNYTITKAMHFLFNSSKFIFILNDVFLVLMRYRHCSLDLIYVISEIKVFILILSPFILTAITLKVSFWLFLCFNYLVALEFGNRLIEKRGSNQRILQKGIGCRRSRSND